jgi:hypothetical protein
VLLEGEEADRQRQDVQFSGVVRREDALAELMAP